MSNYKEESVLCAIKISSWGIDRTDKTAQRSFAQSEGVSEDAYKILKQIVTPEFKKQLDSGNALLNKVKYKYLFATGATSLGIMPIAVKEKFLACVQEANEQRREIVRSALESKYETEKEHAKLRLGTHYREQDYPTIDEICDKYKVKYFFMPLPSPEKTGIEDVDLQQAVADARRETLAAAKSDAWNRIMDTCRKFVERLQNFHDKNQDGKTTRFHDSVVLSLQDLVATLEEMNIFDDIALTQSLDVLKSMISDVAPETLKHDDMVRLNCIKIAQSVLDKTLPETIPSPDGYVPQEKQETLPVEPVPETKSAEFNPADMF